MGVVNYRTKAEWLDALRNLPESIKQRTGHVRFWLQFALDSSNVRVDVPLTTQDIINVIQRAARQERALAAAGRQSTITYLDILGGDHQRMDEAWSFARSLAHICRYVGGEPLGDAVYEIAIADRAPLWRKLLDMRDSVFIPMTPCVVEALQNRSKTFFLLGGAQVNISYMGGWFYVEIHTRYRSESENYLVVSLRAARLEDQWARYQLLSAYGGSLGELLQLLDSVIAGFAEREDGGQGLLAHHYPKPEPVSV